jgi:hypothetical protein
MLRKTIGLNQCGNGDDALGSLPGKGTVGPRERRLRPILLSALVVLVLVHVRFRGPLADVVFLSFCLLGVFSVLVAHELDLSLGSEPGPGSRRELTDASIRALRSFGWLWLHVAAAVVTVYLLWWVFGRPE